MPATHQYDEDKLELPHAEEVHAQEDEGVGEGDQAPGPQRQAEQHLEAKGG
jgi:hypothetical protein